MAKMVSASLQTAARDALTCQTACNLSGVVNAFSRAMPAIWDSVRATGGGTDDIKKHPITILFVDKIASMVGDEGLARYSQATAACERMAEL
jgi:hypothetical protein